MAMFTAYFDASGNYQSPTAMFVSGAVASTDDWIAFEAEWLALLDANGMKPPFHMKDFKSGAHPYEAWKNKLAKQQKFELAALDLIQRRAWYTFAQGIVIPDFDRMHATFDIPKSEPWGKTINKPLAHCGVAVVLRLNEWVQREAKKGKLDMQGDLEIIFDRGDMHRGELASALRDVFSVEPGFKEAAKFAPLQAADMLAWYHRRAVDDYVQKKAHWLGAPFKKLADDMPGNRKWAFSRWHKLRDYCKEKGYPLKP